MSHINGSPTIKENDKMKAVIKQDFLRRRSGVLISSLVLFLINITLIVAAWMSDKGGGAGLQTFIEIAMPIVCMIDTLGIFIWALDQGAYNIGKDLRGDVGYVYKMVPRSGWNLLGGKLIVGLAEFLIYAIQSYIYIRIIAHIFSSDPSGASDSFDLVWTFNGASSDVAGEAKFFLNPLFIIFAAGMQFVLGATLVSFCAIMGNAFLKNRRFTKAIVAVGIFALATLVGRITARILIAISGGYTGGSFTMSGMSISGMICIGLLIELAFSALFYVLTCILWEKKVSV